MKHIWDVYMNMMEKNGKSIEHVWNIYEYHDEVWENQLENAECHG